MALLKVVGFDPSLRHWGIASGVYDLSTKKLEVTYVDVLEPIIERGKTVRQNSKDLSSAYQLSRGAKEAAKGANAIFVEVPHGSQSARAMASYGICVGILGSLRAEGFNFFELTEREVKSGSIGKTSASKREMIQWATTQFPDAPWSTYSKGGVAVISEAKAEHQADAAATIFSGVQLPQFQQLTLFNS